MPNWCTTDIVMVGTKENVKKLYDDVTRLLETSRKGTTKEKDSFLNESNWLGYVVMELLEKSWKDMDCRGTVESIDTPMPMDCSNRAWKLQMLWLVAWCPCYQLQKELAAKYNLQLYFLAEEGGNLVYETNDTDGYWFPSRYKWKEEYYDSFEALVADFITEYGGEVRNLEHLQERMKNEITEEDEYGDCYNYIEICRLVNDDGEVIKE